MDIILTLGIILVIGYFFGLIAETFSIPRVTSYLFAGVIFSEGLLGHLIDLKLQLWSGQFSQVCLGFIAYIVGSEIELKTFKHNGRVVLWGTLLSSSLPVIFVFLVFFFLSNQLSISPEFSIIIAAISATTAPAATMAVIDQYKSKGELTNTTLGIVALDDAFGILIFILITNIFFQNGRSDGFTIFFKEVVLSIGLGTFFGILLSKFAKFSLSNDYLFPLLMGITLSIVSLTHFFHLSSLLACITLGLVANNTNIKDHPKVSLLLPLKHIEEFIFITFFTLAGSHFSLKYFTTALTHILLYVTARAVGKYIGAYIGSKMGKPANKETSKWLGLTLLPQAGVAIGLVFQTTKYPEIAPYSNLLINIILGSTIIYEVLGPLAAKVAFKKVGEIESLTP